MRDGAWLRELANCTGDKNADNPFVPKLSLHMKNCFYSEVDKINTHTA
jgi:hypothetical protein